jgi:hypothetical protein
MGWWVPGEREGRYSRLLAQAAQIEQLSTTLRATTRAHEDLQLEFARKSKVRSAAERGATVRKPTLRCPAAQ